MRGRIETPAGEARCLHQKVKAFRAHLIDAGYPDDASYMVLLNVVLRLAYEEHGEQGIATVRSLLGDMTSFPELEALLRQEAARLA